MYSFDIFDTLITRRTASPKGIFMIMQEHMKGKEGYSPLLVNNFYELRAGAEELARAYAASMGAEEVTLDDIYRSLATTSCITERQQDELKELEIETECKNVLGIRKNIRLLKNLKNQGKQVVLISDMYLGENTVRRMLDQVDSVFKTVPVYVSSEYGKTKGSGGLFRIVKNKEDVEYSDWVHYGDNEYADIRSASSLGIKAVRLDPKNIEEYEHPQKDLYHQLSIGASRYVRNIGSNDVASEVGSSLAGPILYPYVKWVLRESLVRGINRLYFVARDGWILKQIADKIIQIEKYPVKTHYIYGSRRVWRLPSYDGSVEDFDRLLQWSNMEEVLSLNDLAEVFRLGIEKLRVFLPEEFQKSNGCRRLLKFERDNICRQLRENKNFRAYLVKGQAESRNMVIRYLKQEMDVCDDKYAFVELAGTGFTQKCLSDLIKNFYDGEIKNFYFKLDSIQEKGQCCFINFYPSKMERSYMLELLCRAPHGQTEAYMERSGCIMPVLEKHEGKQIQEYGLEDYRTAVLAYAEQMEHTYIGNGLAYISKINIVREYMNLISRNPPKKIAEYFCHMPFSSGGRRKTVVEFAPTITNKQIRKIYFWKNAENFRQIYKGNSLEYALAVSDRAKEYSEKCLRYRKTKAGRWLADWNRYLHTRQKPGTDYFCPWELLKGNIVIYGAGKVGQAYVKQAGQKYARCNSFLWVDSNYDKLRESGLDVKPPEDIMKQPFDRIIISIHNSGARQEVWDMLRGMGVEAGKIYYG